MKKLYIIFTILLYTGSLRLYAQQHWAVAVLRNGTEEPAILEYHGIEETANNGKMYYRIFDDSYLFRKDAYNPVKLQYGYRWGEKQMFIYDFENQKETLAFDFNLSEGDHFTTFNGMEWEIKMVKDTLVNTSFCGKGEPTRKKLLTVKDINGTMTDQWLEDFGSFSNHFMINGIDNGDCTLTLWMEYDMGEYLAREINSDPFFAHDTGWMEEAYRSNDSKPHTRCTYENGQVVFENTQLWYEHRDYSCYYREGDNIYRVYVWEFEPHIDNGTLTLRKDAIAFIGLPIPASGKYGVHIDDNVYTTRIDNVRSVSISANSKYDLKGRILNIEPQKGIFIRDGKKVAK